MLLQRFVRSILMFPADDPPAGGAPAQPPAPAAPPAAPALPPDLQKLVADPEQFKARLERERAAERASMLKDLGVKDPEEIKAVLKAHKDAEEARKSDAQKSAEKIAALEPEAKRAGELAAAVKEYLDAEEKQIPDEKKGLMELAPTEPDARLKWIAKAKLNHLFDVTPAAPGTPATPATSRAGSGNPPPPAPAPTQKSTRDMTPEEFAKYEAQWRAKHTPTIS